MSGRVLLDGSDAGNYLCAYFSIPEFEVWNDRFPQASTEADARAKMLIYLLESGTSRLDQLTARSQGEDS